MVSQITCTSVQASYTLPFPKEQLLNVFSHLELPTLHDYMQLGEVCRSWYVLRSDPQFWQIVAKRLNIPLEEQGAEFIQIHAYWNFAQSVKGMVPKHDLPFFYFYINKPWNPASFEGFLEYNQIKFPIVPEETSDNENPTKIAEDFFSAIRELFKILPPGKYPPLLKEFYSLISNAQKLSNDFPQEKGFVHIDFSLKEFREWCQAKQTITFPMGFGIFFENDDELDELLFKFEENPRNLSDEEKFKSILEFDGKEALLFEGGDVMVDIPKPFQSRVSVMVFFDLPTTFRYLKKQKRE